MYSHGLQHLFKAYFFVFYSPVGFVNASPIGYQSCVIWRLSLESAVKVGALDVGRSFFQGNIRDFVLVLEPEGEERGNSHWLFWAPGRIAVSPICMLIRSQILRQQFIEYAFKSLPGKTRRWAVLPPSSALSPGGIAAVSTQVGLLRTVSSFVTVL